MLHGNIASSAFLGEYEWKFYVYTMLNGFGT